MGKRKPKMSTGEAVKILANESKQMKAQILNMFEAMQRTDMIVRDYAALFERYIEHTEDGDAFVSKMKKLIEEKVEDDKKANEQSDNEDTDGDKQDEGVGTEWICPR